MARPRVAVGGDSPWIWRVAENTFNKQLRTADKGCSAWWLGGKLITHHRKNQLVTKCYTRHRELWEDNIRMDIREIGWGGVDWMRLSQDRDWWRAVVNTIMKFWVP